MKNTTELVRPKTQKDFIGQRDVATEVKIALASARLRRDAFPHAIFSGAPGLGKTSLAEIIASEMDVPFISILGASIRDEDGLRNILSQLPIDGYDLKTGEIIEPDKVRHGIVFIDEIHRLKKNLTELLHTALEDFKISMKVRNPLTGRMQSGLFWMPKFTLIGATNYLGILPRPFVDRFMIQASFEPYTEEEIIQIAHHSARKLELDITEDAIQAMASKSRGVPRILNRFLLRVRDVAIYSGHSQITLECAEEMFQIQNIDELGLTKLDRRVLEYLAEIIRPVGIGSIAQAVDEDKNTIENLVEPWLIRLRLMTKTSQGRQITELGLKHLGNEFNPESGLRRISS
jgi:Holliday junction DNA helicase RuvB